jgi:Arc/MetJ-type ribon-helix-helix transcriptional regulator
LDSGTYKSDVEVIRAGLRALDRDDGEKARRLTQLDASIVRDEARLFPEPMYDVICGEPRPPFLEPAHGVW